MQISRREWSWLFAAAAAAEAAAKNSALPSKAFRFEDLEIRKGKTMTSRPILNGETHTGSAIDLHETELAAGQAPHAPHKHVHEEMLLIREGTLEVTIAGRSTTLGAGSVAYIASNEEHGWKNTGATPASYFVLALGRDDQ